MELIQKGSEALKFGKKSGKQLKSLIWGRKLLLFNKFSDKSYPIIISVLY